VEPRLDIASDEALRLAFDPPRLTPAEAEEIARREFGLEGRASPLPSERDQNFLLQAMDGRGYVLKIANATEDRAILELQHAALDLIAERAPDLGVPRVLHSVGGGGIVSVTGGDGGAHLVRVLSWVPGVPLATARPRTPAMLRSLGRLLGRLDAALEGFDPLAARRRLKWDLVRAGWIRDHFSHVTLPVQRSLVDRVFALFERQALPLLPRLRTAVICNDANDYNVLVAESGAEPRETVGLIDFGDMVRTALVAEPAIAAAYALLGCADPLAAVAEVVGGYHAAFPLEEIELEALFPLICARLCVSVVNSAYQRSVSPDNAYLRVSEAPAWAALERLAEIPPRLAHYRLREACGLPRCPAYPAVVEWIAANSSRSVPVLSQDPGEAPPALVDLSVGSPFLQDLSLAQDPGWLGRRIRDSLEQTGTRIGIGRYDEARPLYTAEQYRCEGLDGPEWRTIHLGLDLFAEPGTPVRSPLPGRVHSVRNNAAPLDYGPTVIVEHAVETDDRPLRFYTLYGHLDLATLREIRPGRPVAAGTVVGWLGDCRVNGGWPPHLHFQLIVDLLDHEGEFPGVARPGEGAVWKSLSPDPSRLAGFAPPQSEGLTASEILERRSRLLGPSLSVAYRRPLHLVRGWMQYLFDAEGRRYLDAVNNVAHVGHCHPRVVRAGQAQMAVLNTNTRYLHPAVLRYVERLTATLPEPLRVCFLVNSGSEANELALRLGWTHTGRKGTVVVDSAYYGNTSTLIELSPYKCEGPGGGGLAAYARKVPLPDPYRGLHRGPTTGPRYAEHVRVALEELARGGWAPGAFIGESLPSCGGQIVLPDGFLREAYAQARAAGAVCIADEVQTGFGRVGTHFWGFETQDVVPDIVTMGKPAGNGHPLGVVVTSPDIAASFANGMEYFNTFGGNPVSCDIGLAVLDVIEEEGLQARALAVGTRLLGQLRELQRRHPGMGEVRGLGLFLGVELVADPEARTPDGRAAAYVANRLRECGILLSTDGPDHNVLKIKPPLVFEAEDADRLAQTLDEVLGEDYVRRER